MTEASLAQPSTEKLLASPASGWVMLGLILTLAVFGVLMLRIPFIGGPLLLIAGIASIGFLVIKPNDSAVLTLFGRYVGTDRR